MKVFIIKAHYLSKTCFWQKTIIPCKWLIVLKNVFSGSERMMWNETCHSLSAALYTTWYCDFSPKRRESFFLVTSLGSVLGSKWAMLVWENDGGLILGIVKGNNKNKIASYKMTPPLVSNTYLICNYSSESFLKMFSPYWPPHCIPRLVHQKICSLCLQKV